MKQPDLTSEISRPNRYRSWTAASVDGLSVGLKTSLWLIAIMVPTGFLVWLLRLVGLLTPLAVLLDPLMGLAGLPGEAAFVLATAAFITIYPAIGVMATIDLSGPQIAVIGLMVLICHNLFVETAIQAKVGSNPVRILLLRVVGAFVVGIVVAPVLGLDRIATGARELSFSLGFPAWQIVWLELISWVQATAATVVRVIGVVVVLMVGQRLLEYWGVLSTVARGFGPLVVFFGLPRSTAFLWIIANTLGLTYGAAVILEERRLGHVSRFEADLLNHHLAVCHSLLEDTLLFVALGAGPVVLTVPRLVLAFVAVWTRRIFLRRSGERPAVTV